MARPRKINERVIDEIAKLVRAGNYLEVAAQYAGIDVVTLYDWMKRGAWEKERREKPYTRPRQDEEVFVQFSNTIKEALAEAELRDVNTITAAANDGQWTAAAWRLERKFPKRWGRKAIEVTGADGGPIQHEVEHKTEESREDQFERLFAAIDQYRADVDVPDGGTGEEQPVDTNMSNGKAT
jgi:hypothetical protein